MHIIFYALTERVDETRSRWKKKTTGGEKSVKFCQDHGVSHDSLKDDKEGETLKIISGKGLIYKLTFLERRA